MNEWINKKQYLVNVVHNVRSLLKLLFRFEILTKIPLINIDKEHMYKFR